MITTTTTLIRESSYCYPWLVTKRRWLSLFRLECLERSQRKWQTTAEALELYLRYGKNDDHERDKGKSLPASATGGAPAGRGPGPYLGIGLDANGDRPERIALSGVRVRIHRDGQVSASNLDPCLHPVAFFPVKPWDD